MKHAGPSVREIEHHFVRARNRHRVVGAEHEHAAVARVLPHREMERLGAEIVWEGIRTQLAVAENADVVLHADDDLVGRERDVVARLRRAEPVDVLYEREFLPDLLARHFHRLLKKRDDAPRHGGIGHVPAVVHDFQLHLERHFAVGDSTQRRGRLRAIQRHLECQRTRREGVHLDGDERLRGAG